MATAITNENVNEIDPSADYNVFYVHNTRTKVMHQYAIMSGESLRKVYEKSPRPERIRAFQCGV